MKKNRIAIFASGNGTNAERIIEYFNDHPHIEVVVLLSNNANAFALERARQHNIPALAFDRTQFTGSEVVLHWLQEHQVTHVVLAGFLWLIPRYFLTAFPDRIINIHPALLPKFGGKGMYGSKVHEAVLAAGEKESGITIHVVNEHYDEGQILFQGSCAVEQNCTPALLANKVHELEHHHYPRVIEKWILDSDSK